MRRRSVEQMRVDQRNQRWGGSRSYDLMSEQWDGPAQVITVPASRGCPPGYTQTAGLRDPSRDPFGGQTIQCTYTGTVQAELEREAQPAPPAAQLLRKGIEAGDQDVPVRSFHSDLMRKIRLRRVMPKPDDQDQDKSEQDLEPHRPGDPATPDASDEDATDEHKYTQEEVNYRYSGDEDHQCGVCRFFIEPGACRIVTGLIRPVDVCDKFQPKDEDMSQDEDEEGEREAVRAELDYSGSVVQAEQDDDDDADIDQDCEPWERDEDGNCPTDDDTDFLGEKEGEGAVVDFPDKRVHFEPHKFHGPDDEHLKSEVTPPGGERIVKALKKKQDSIDEPYAVAWAMKKKRMGPWGEVSPPGWSGTVKAMKKHMPEDVAFQRAWAMYHKGATPHYPPEQSSERGIVMAELEGADEVGGRGIHLVQAELEQDATAPSGAGGMGTMPSMPTMPSPPTRTAIRGSRR